MTTIETESVTTGGRKRSADSAFSNDDNSDISSTIEVVTRNPSPINVDERVEVGVKNIAEKLADRLRSMDSSKLFNIGAFKHLSDLAVGTVMEVCKIEERSGKFGPIALLSYFATNKDGARLMERVSCPKWVVEKPEPLKVPSLLVYMGKSSKKSNQGESFHDVRRIACQPSSQDVYNEAEGLRKLTTNELIEKLTTRSIGTFPAGTVFVTTKQRLVKKRN